MINSVVFEGNVVEDVQAKQITRADGSIAHVVNFRLACNRPLTQTQNEARKAGQQVQTEADFVSCTAWKNLNLTHGTRLIVQGALRTGSYTNQQGAKVYTTEIAVDDISFPVPRNPQAPTANPAVVPAMAAPQATMPAAPAAPAYTQPVQPVQATMPTTPVYTQPTAPQPVQPAMPAAAAPAPAVQNEYIQAAIPGQPEAAQLPFN